MRFRMVSRESASFEKHRSKDEYFMRESLRLARQGGPVVSPNPRVGACVVKNNRIISTGYHRVFGGPHAEVEAIRKAGARARGASLYVTLEPCSTIGKTGPCVDIIKRVGIANVVAGINDPNPMHSGRGFQVLKKAGIRVTSGVLKRECLLVIEAYAKWIQTKQPFVILKMAQSLDGKIATYSGKSRWISGKAARKWVQTLRASCDAIVVGSRTLQNDNPALNVRQKPPAKQPWAILLDRKSVLSANANVFRANRPVVLVCDKKMTRTVEKRYNNRRLLVLPVQVQKKQLDLKEMLDKLGSLGVTSLLVEGGGELAWSFLENKQIDKVFWFISPRLIGGRTAKTAVEGKGVNSPDEGFQLKNISARTVGEDLLIEGLIRK